MTQADCIFCHIINGSIPSTKVYEDDQSVAFEDTNPKAPVHYLVVPKQHLASLAQTTPEHDQLLGHLLGVVRKVAEDKGISKSGYKVIQNIGRDGGQVVPHVHFHVLGGQTLIGVT